MRSAYDTHWPCGLLHHRKDRDCRQNAIGVPLGSAFHLRPVCPPDGLAGVTGVTGVSSGFGPRGPRVRTRVCLVLIWYEIRLDIARGVGGLVIIQSPVS